MLDRGEIPYLKARVSFGGYTKDTPGARKTPSEDNFSEGLIFKNMEIAYGAVAANAVLSHISHTIGKSRSEILSDFATFSKYVIQVCGEAEARKFLSKIPATS